MAQGFAAGLVAQGFAAGVVAQGFAAGLVAQGFAAGLVAQGFAAGLVAQGFAAGLVAQGFAAGVVAQGFAAGVVARGFAAGLVAEGFAASFATTVRNPTVGMPNAAYKASRILIRQAESRRAPVGSALAELSRTACLVAAVLLAFNLAGIASHEAVFAQQLLEVDVFEAERAGNAKADSAGLTGDATTDDVAPDVIAVASFRHGQRHRGRATRVVREEELLELQTVDHELAGPGLDAHASAGSLATAGAPDIRIIYYHLMLLNQLLADDRSQTMGFCASCGCEGPR